MFVSSLCVFPYPGKVPQKEWMIEFIILFIVLVAMVV